MMRIALLDFDGTLASGHLGADLVGTMLDHGIGNMIELRRVLDALEAYRTQRLSFDRTAEIVYDRYAKALHGISEHQLDEVIEIAVVRVRPRLNAGLYSLADRLRSLGFEPIVISGSPEAVVRMVAKDMGITQAYGAALDAHEGVLSARYRRSPGRAGAKLAVLSELIAAATITIDLGSSIAAGNSMSDLGLLMSVGAPLAVEPDADLQAVVRRNGWPMCARSEAVPHILSLAKSLA